MYNKLFAKILDSSIWLEPMPTRIVWITLLAAMDEDGYAHFSAIENLSARARVTIEECNAAVTALSEPDKNSADPDNDGRRIERVQGGFVVLNAQKYREIVNQVSRRTATRLRVQKFREKKSVTLGNALVTKCNAASEYECTAESESEEGSGGKPPKAKNEIDLSPLGKRIATWFNRRETTRWAESELKLLKKVEALGTHEDDLGLLEKRYVAKEPYIRQDISTLLNNWNAEIDRAKRSKLIQPPKPQEPWQKQKHGDVLRERIKDLENEFQVADPEVKSAIREEVQMLRAELATLNGVAH